MTADLQASGLGKRPSEGKSLILEIQTHVANALSELFVRAQRDNAVRDSKPVDEAEGLVQDCEFGLILMLGRAWLKEQNALPPDLVDDDAVRGMVVSLVEKTAVTLLTRRQFDKGGDSPGSSVFFSGAPYTRIKDRRDPYFSANLDSAMLVLGFFAPALKEYHTLLTTIPATKTPEVWIKSLRDVALYICRNGVEYAEACQVRSPGFVGFTCDPNSVLNDAKDGPYLNRFDRLFFTWTASETAHELLEWLKSLDSIATGVPQEEVQALRNAVQSLKTALEEAAGWCKTEFLEPFSALSSPVDAALIVQRVQSIGEGVLDPQLTVQVDQLNAHVQHVYHLSQYAAIRSLSPNQVTVREVAEICDRLDTLVSQDIVGSGLDAAKTETLFSLLTRKYALGRGIKELYNDDAYYPLVVRSMSGLLSRTMERLGERANPAEISTLVSDFRRNLNAHYKNLIKRRPDDAADAVLWSYVSGEPYLLYATQRTLFALLAYADFLVKMDAWEKKGATDEVMEASIKSLLSQSLVDALLGPAIKQIVTIAKTQASQAAEQMVSVALAKAQAIQPTDQGQITVPLPKADWAAKVLRDWLEDLGRDFEASRLDAYLQGQAQILLERREWANTLEDPRNDKDLTASLKRTRESFQRLMTKYGLGDLDQPTVADVLPQMFLELFDSPRKSPRGKDYAETEYGKTLKLAEGTKTLSDNPRIKVGKP